MNPILDKIKKLLRLAKCNSASPAEAATALKKAMQMAQDNGIEVATVRLLEDHEWTLSHVTTKSQAGPAHRLAAALVTNHFGVEILFDSRDGVSRIHFIGLPTNCQLAEYVYCYLVRAMRAAWRKRSNKRLRDREAFLKGYATAIHQLMPATFRNEGLILSAKAYTEAVIIGNKPGRSVAMKPVAAKASDRALREGYIAGQKAGIRNGIHGTSHLALDNQ